MEQLTLRSSSFVLGIELVEGVLNLPPVDVPLQMKSKARIVQSARSPNLRLQLLPRVFRPGHCVSLEHTLIDVNQN